MRRLKEVHIGVTEKSPKIGKEMFISEIVGSSRPSIVYKFTRNVQRVRHIIGDTYRVDTEDEKTYIVKVSPL